MRFVIVALLALSSVNAFFKVQVEDRGFLLWWVKFVPRIDLPFVDPQLNYEGSTNKYYVFAGYFRKLKNRDLGLTMKVKIGDNKYQDFPLTQSKIENGNLIYDFGIFGEEFQKLASPKGFAFSGAEYDSANKRFYVYVDLINAYPTLEEYNQVSSLLAPITPQATEVAAPKAEVL